jgi:murein DD-endopeptidase
MLVATLAAAIAGCAPFRPGLPSEPLPPSAGSSDAGTLLARAAMAQVGVPYRYGGDDPREGFDCSGLVAFVHGQEGIAVPRTAAAQFAAARKVGDDERHPGDLVFFRLVPGSRQVTHVGIYTGAGRFVHAPQTGRRVGEARLDDPYFLERYAGTGRFYGREAGAGPRIKSSPR